MTPVQADAVAPAATLAHLLARSMAGAVFPAPGWRSSVTLPSRCWHRA
jgi:hypothetical protein